MMTANRFFTLALAVMLLGGCASKGSFTEGDVEARNARLNKQSEAKTVEVLSGPYVGAVPVRLAKTDVLLDSRITLNMRGSLEAICTQARQLVPLSFQVLDEDMPKTSTRSFSQRVTMKMGQTLVLAGFEQEKVGSSRDLGLFSAQKGDTYKRTLMVITISVESVPGYMEGDPKDTLVSGLTPEMARELFNAVRASLSGQEAA